MPKKTNSRGLPPGIKKPTKETSGITQSHNSDSCEYEFGVTSVGKESFEMWQRIIQDQFEKLAKAGSIYSDGNKVLCYCWDVSLDDMNLRTDHWVEHANLHSMCPHVVLTKGFKLIEDIQVKERGEVSATANSNENDTGVVSKPKESDLMDSPAVAALREFVDSETVIRQAVEYMINHSNGTKPITARDLMKIVDVIEGKDSNLEVDETCEHAETILKLAPGSIRKPTSGVSNTILEGNADIEKNQKEKELWNEQRLCKICLKAMTCVMFMPCGHCMSCPQCAPALKECLELI